MGQIPPHSWSLPPLKADSREALPPPREREMGCADGQPQWLLPPREPIPSPLWHPDLLCGHCLDRPCQLPPALPGPGPASLSHPAWNMSPLAFSFTQYQERESEQTPEDRLSCLESQKLSTGSTTLLSYSDAMGSSSQGSKELAPRGIEPSLSNRHPSITCAGN